MPSAQQVREIFEQSFGTPPRIFRAPGRVNIIGEHTDYNEGFVLPSAIDRSAYLAIGPAAGEKGTWISADFSDKASVGFSDIRPHEKKWVNYLLGVAEQFIRAGHHIPPLNLVLSSEVPIGAGLSSSAALESVMAFALNSILDSGYDRLSLAKMARRAENDFIGLQCGIMDMFTSLHGKKDHVIRLDCRSLDFEYFPLELGDYRILLLDTGVKHSLASSEYNLRRAQCEEGVMVLQKTDSAIFSLRDVTTEILEAKKSAMDPLVYRRCYFVVEENIRVGKACAALRTGSLHQLGQLMYASHRGLQFDYEVSCSELDLLVKLVQQEDLVLGARMMGGGFGGCTINLVHKDTIPALMKKIGPAYLENTGLELKAIGVVTADGAEEFPMT